MQIPKGLPLDAVLQLLYHYMPNKGAAAAAVALYAVVTVGLTLVTVKTRLHYMFIVVLTAVLELTGWATHLSVFATAEVTKYSVHKALLIISPVLLALVQYITLYRLLQLPPLGSHKKKDPTSASTESALTWEIGVGANGAGRSAAGQDHACPAVISSGSDSGSDSTNSSSSSSRSSGGHPIFAKSVLVGFTVAAAICLLLQTSGAALYADPGANALYGRLLLLSGLGLQLIFDSAFVTLTAVVQRSRYFSFRGDRSLRPVFTCLYATTLLVHWRNVFRVAEFSQGPAGNVAQHEAYLYVLDFMPLYACFLLYGFLHYGFWLGPAAPAMVARLAASTSSLELGEKQQQQQQQQPEMDILHVHCS